MKRLIFWVVGIGLFVGLLWMGWSFRAGNAMPIELDLIWIRVPEVEIWRVILTSIALGAIVAGTFVGFAWMRVRLVNRRFRRAIRRLEAELHEMRSLPLSEAEPQLGGEVRAAAAGEQR